MTSILIVGVGGQGTLLASKVIGRLALARGLDAKVSEVHGMSQRGGSVVTYVRYGARVRSPLVEHVHSPLVEHVHSPLVERVRSPQGERVRSPLVEPGGADLLIACELLEAARWLPYLKPGGAAVASVQRVMPMPVITGAAKYPDGLVETVREACPGAVFVDALAIANACGDKRAANIAMLGAASRYMPFSGEEWDSALKAATPPKAIGANLRAFREGAACPPSEEF